MTVLRRKPKVGEVWRVQRQAGNALLTAHVDELTPRTVVLRYLDDGSIYVNPSLLPLRWARDDITFVERVVTADHSESQALP